MLGSTVLLSPAIDELSSDVPVESDADEGEVEESVGEVFDVVVEEVDEVEDVLEVELVDEVDESVVAVPSSSPGVAVIVKEVETPSSRVGVIDGENDDDVEEDDEVEVDEEVDDVADPRVGKIDGENEEDVVGEPREGVIEGVKEVRVGARSVTEVIMEGDDDDCVLEVGEEEEEEEELELDEGTLELELELEEAADELEVEGLDVVLLLLLLDGVDDVEPDDNQATMLKNMHKNCNLFSLCVLFSLSPLYFVSTERWKVSNSHVARKIEWE